MSHWITTTSGAIVDVTKARAIWTHKPKEDYDNAWIDSMLKDQFGV